MKPMMLLIGILSLGSLGAAPLAADKTADCPTCPKTASAAKTETKSLLKVDQYDTVSDDFEDAADLFCIRLAQCKLEKAITGFQADGYDWVHAYPAIHCDDDFIAGLPFAYDQRKNAGLYCVAELVRELVRRDHLDNGTSGDQCLYCQEIFNLKNLKGETLVDLFQRLHRMYGAESAGPKMVDLLRSIGAKTAAELASAP